MSSERRPDGGFRPLDRSRFPRPPSGWNSWFYPLDEKARPPIFDLKVAQPAVGTWDVVACFNWGEKETRKFELSPAKLGLEPGAYVWLNVFRGASRVVANDPCRIRLHVPEGYSVATPGVEQYGRLAVLTLRRERSEEITWEVAFERLHPRRMRAARKTRRQKKDATYHDGYGRTVAHLRARDRVGHRGGRSAASRGSHRDERPGCVGAGALWRAR